MWQRCTNPSHPRWDYYGGRGITVDPAWRSFSAFLSDMGERTDGRTLERIDNERGYSAKNCRWATPKEQSANRRERRLDPTTLKARCKAAGMPYHTVYQRLKAGWEWSKAISKPIRPHISDERRRALGEEAKSLSHLPTPTFTPSTGISM
jgi:hypothetical protein